MTTTHDVALPAGTEIGIDWDQYNEAASSRWIRGKDRTLADRPDFIVCTSAIQDRDGTIHDRGCTVYVSAHDELTVAQARELAELLLAAADQLDGWAA